MTQEIQDYITLSRRAYTEKYEVDSKEYIAKIREMKNTQFEEGHISNTHKLLISETLNKDKELENIKSLLQKKRFSEQYIKDYMAALSVGTDRGKTSKNMIKNIISEFRYRNRKLQPNDLKSALELDDLEVLNNSDENKKFITDMINTTKGLDVMSHYALGLTSLANSLESTARKKKLKIQNFDEGELLGIIDPRMVKSRKKFYDHWEKVYDKFDDLRGAIQKVLIEWEGIEKQIDKLDDGSEDVKIIGLKESETFFTELDRELKKLYELYQDMDDKNYVIKSRSIYYPVASDDDEETLMNVHNAIIEKIKDIFDEGDSLRSIEEQDEEFEIDEEDIDIYEGYGSEEGDSQRGAAEAEFGVGQSGAPQIAAENFRKQIDNITRISQVDPIYGIAAQKGIVKDPFSKTAYIKFLEILKQEIQEENEIDSGVAEDLQELLDEHEERREQVADVSRDWFYLPFTQEVYNFYDESLGFEDKQNKEIKIPNYESLEKFHLDLLKTVGELIEEPLNRTTMPEIWEQADMPTGGDAERGQKKITEDTKQHYHIMSRFRLGHLGSLREDLGEFEEAIEDLLVAIQEYYVKPSYGEFMVFRDTPKFLRSQELAQFTGRGAPNQLIAQLFTQFLTVGIGLIDKNDLIQINNYRKALTTTSPSEKLLINTTEDVLDIVEDFTDDISIDKKYFASILERIARTNRNVNIGQLKIRGESVQRLADEYNNEGKPQPMYKYLIAFIAAKSKLFQKDANKSNQMKTFMSLHTERGDMIRLSVPERAVLIVHDEIRKMLNKPTYEGYGRLDDFDNINDTIELIKSQYKTELTATDIVGIVNEFESMNSIANKYGVNEDVVYHVKAVFR